jgi:hypothetical protein
MSNRGPGSAGEGGTARPPAGSEAAIYRIRVGGHPDARWSAWFDDMGVTADGDGTTTLAGVVVDQVALHGILRKVRDLGLPLLAVTRDETGSGSAQVRSHVAGPQS